MSELPIGIIDILVQGAQGVKQSLDILTGDILKEEGKKHMLGLFARLNHLLGRWKTLEMNPLAVPWMEKACQIPLLNQLFYRGGDMGFGQMAYVDNICGSIILWIVGQEEQNVHFHLGQMICLQ